MTHSYFFGYGSLVNAATHRYAPTERLRIQGWRRTWRQVADHPVALLSAMPDDDSAIDGLIAPVPDNNWAALDAREQGYNRLVLTPAALPDSYQEHDIAIYAVPESPVDADPHKRPILLSYLDVVLQGYLQQFGPLGAEQFLATTDGWDRPVQDDRAAPRYPRHQALDATQLAFVDSAIERLALSVIQP
ncbi:MAG TPA: gamma-glutamylcyclotransferase [Rhodobacteraceae bacterium]|nr:gamma-glutamylcyclotransferase [Paracoccaceae bacterium]HBS40701.1 gamma-glutamylcyclotransferase [Paracoccaceae bacterium]